MLPPVPAQSASDGRAPNCASCFPVLPLHGHHWLLRAQYDRVKRLCSSFSSSSSLDTRKSRVCLCPEEISRPGWKWHRSGSPLLAGHEGIDFGEIDHLFGRWLPGKIGGVGRHQLVFEFAGRHGEKDAAISNQEHGLFGTKSHEPLFLCSRQTKARSDCDNAGPILLLQEFDGSV